jgi:hypothetical protein
VVIRPISLLETRMRRDGHGELMVRKRVRATRASEVETEQAGGVPCCPRVLGVYVEAGGVSGRSGRQWGRKWHH